MVAQSTSARDPLNQYLAEIRAIPPISAEDEQALLKAARAGDAAAQRRVTESYLELTCLLAVKLAPPAMSWLDAVQEANRTLLSLIQDERVDCPALSLAQRIFEDLQANM